MATEWHRTKNGNLTPYDVTANYSERVHWFCPVHPDRKWYVSPNQRRGGDRGCRTCGEIVKACGVGIKKFTDHPDVALLEGTLYYILLIDPKSRKFFKIGFTSGPIDRRFRDYVGPKHGLKITALAKWRSSLAAVVSVEQEILDEFRRFRTEERILYSGNTEVFDCDVLELAGDQATSIKRSIRNRLKQAENRWKSKLDLH